MSFRLYHLTFYNKNENLALLNHPTLPPASISLKFIPPNTEIKSMIIAFIIVFMLIKLLQSQSNAPHGSPFLVRYFLLHNNCPTFYMPNLVSQYF